MGQYLAVGINHQYTVSQGDADKTGRSLDECIEIFKKKCAPDDMYDMQMKEGYKDEPYALFTLKSEVVKDELVPLLRDFYDLYYGGIDETQEKLFERLNNVSTYQQMLDIAKEKCYEWFQNDEYGESGHIGVNSPLKRSLRYGHDAIILCLEGKIFMEESGGIFGMLSDLLAEKFSKYKLSKAFDVYITG